jgi:error-prone DNA polymerase
VHPYLRRREQAARGDTDSWRNEVHEKLHNALAKTYGVPLFQEQLMEMAIDAAGFDPGQADQLRRAMGSKRSAERMAKLKDQLYAGMAERGIRGKEADDIYRQLAAFADFGFPESHAISFAYLVYASAWLKCHYPAAFTAALLNAQPMGFYSTNTLVADARRHGITVRRPDVNLSDATATLEECEETARPPVRATAAIRLGLSHIRGLNTATAQRIAAGRPYADMADVARRARLSQRQLEALATAGACDGFGVDRRAALWVAGAAARDTTDTLAGTAIGLVAPTLPTMSTVELSGADYWALGLSPDSHPVQFVRTFLTAGGVRRIDTLGKDDYGAHVWVAGLVTHRQRPSTAHGTTFLNLEDESGMLNVICSEGLWKRYRRLARTAVGLRVRGVIEGVPGVINLVADKLLPLELPLQPRPSRDFR